MIWGCPNFEESATLQPGKVGWGLRGEGCLCLCLLVSEGHVYWRDEKKR
jgi:hypothetical protein